MDKEQSPLLRFPGFISDWESIRIGELAEVTTGNKDTKDKVKEGKYPFFVRSDKVEKIDTFSYDGEAVLTSGDGVGVGKNFHYYIGKFDFHQRVYCIFNFDSKLSGKYFYYCFSRNFYGRVYRLSAKNSVDSVRMSMIFDMEIPIPSLSEQQKIADFLSAVDKKIELLTRKKELLEQYKKGVMQKLFSQEIRFKDEQGRSYGEWETKRVGDFVNFVKSNSASRNQLFPNEGKVKNIHYGDIHKGLNVFFDSSEENLAFLKPNAINESKLERLKCGDLVLADASEDLKDIGKAIEIRELGTDEVVAGLHTIVLRDNRGITTPGFKGYLFQSYQLRKSLAKLAQGVSVLGISKSSISDIEVQIPPIEEQKKIVSFLDSLVRKLRLIDQSIDYTEQFKKGLLQQMFV